LERNAVARSRDDKILRSALIETLDLLGQENKKIFFSKLGCTENVDRNERYLDYQKVIEMIVQTFASAATPLLHLLDEKIEKHKSRIIESS